MFNVDSDLKISNSSVINFDDALIAGRLRKIIALPLHFSELHLSTEVPHHESQTSKSGGTEHPGFPKPWAMGLSSENATTVASILFVVFTGCRWRIIQRVQLLEPGGACDKSVQGKYGKGMKTQHDSKQWRFIDVHGGSYAVHRYFYVMLKLRIFLMIIVFHPARNAPGATQKLCQRQNGLYFESGWSEVDNGWNMWKDWKVDAPPWTLATRWSKWVNDSHPPALRRCSPVETMMWVWMLSIFETTQLIPTAKGMAVIAPGAGWFSLFSVSCRGPVACNLWFERSMILMVRSMPCFPTLAILP